MYTGSSSPEVKRATIVGNPMYSRAAVGGGAAGPVGDAAPRAPPAESLGLDDLHMDYDQIMHYFHNLKV